MIVKGLITVTAAIGMSGLLFILGDIVVNGGLSIQLDFLLEREISGGRGGGFLNAIVGSVLLVGLALGVAIPLSLGSAIYVQEYADRRNPMSRIVIFTSDVLASTPSIIFGAFGFMFFVFYLKTGFTLFAGGMTLACMVIPLLLRSSIEAVKSVPKDLKDASLALGVSKWRTILRIVLPTAFPMITSGVVISTGRAIGETAAVLLTAGYTPFIVDSLFRPTASMPLMIYNYYNLSTQWPVVHDKLYSAAFLLIVIVLILNIIAKMSFYRGQSIEEQGQSPGIIERLKNLFENA